MTGADRNYSDLITAFVGSVEDSHLPLIFRTWGAISAVAGALGKRSWYDFLNTTGDGVAFTVYPNLYIILLAEPAIGKTASLIVPYNRCYKGLTERIASPKSRWDNKWQAYGMEAPLWMISDRITAEKVGIDMASCYRILPGLSTALDTKGESALTLVTGEFGDLMNKFDVNIQNFLTVAWDSADEYSYRTKGKGDLLIKDPCLNWIAAATPQQFVEYMPSNANGQGLLSRIIVVYYGGEAAPDDLEFTAPSDHKVQMLTEDLAAVSRMEGPFFFDSGETYQTARKWIQGGGQPRPTDPKLINYSNRRKAHIMKVAMAVSASEGDTHRISLAQWERAKCILLGAEKYMPEALSMFGVSNTGVIAKELGLLVAQRKKIELEEFSKAVLEKVHTSAEMTSMINSLSASGIILNKGGWVTKGPQNEN